MDRPPVGRFLGPRGRLTRAVRREIKRKQRRLGKHRHRLVRGTQEGSQGAAAKAREGQCEPQEENLRRTPRLAPVSAPLTLPRRRLVGPSIVDGTVYVRYGLGAAAGGVRAFGLPE